MEALILDSPGPPQTDASVEQTPDHVIQIPYSAGGVVVPDKEWTGQNTRRVALIKKRVRQSLTSEETEELERLQTEMSRQLNATHPLPFEALNELEEYIDQAEHRLGKRD